MEQTSIIMIMRSSSLRHRSEWPCRTFDLKCTCRWGIGVSWYDVKPIGSQWSRNLCRTFWDLKTWFLSTFCETICWECQVQLHRDTVENRFRSMWATCSNMFLIGSAEMIVNCPCEQPFRQNMTPQKLQIWEVQYSLKVDRQTEIITSLYGLIMEWTMFHTIRITVDEFRNDIAVNGTKMAPKSWYFFQ